MPPTIQNLIDNPFLCQHRQPPGPRTDAQRDRALAELADKPHTSTLPARVVASEQAAAAMSAFVCGVLADCERFLREAFPHTTLPAQLGEDFIEDADEGVDAVWEFMDRLDTADGMTYTRRKLFADMLHAIADATDPVSDQDRAAYNEDNEPTPANLPEIMLRLVPLLTDRVAREAEALTKELDQ